MVWFSSNSLSKVYTKICLLMAALFINFASTKMCLLVVDLVVNFALHPFTKL